jgi:hypothetical protein
MLSAAGLRPEKITLFELSGVDIGASDLIAVPSVAAVTLTKAERSRLLAAVERGAKLITDADSELLRALKLTTLPAVSVDTVLYAPDKNGEVHWEKPQTVEPLRYPKDAAKPIYTTVDGRALAVFGTLGHGSFIAMGPLFDPVDGRGYARFPNILNSVFTDMAIKPLVRRNALGVYLDLADREKADFETLAKQWSDAGIRTLYVSAWYYDRPNYRYDEVVSAAHRHGLLVYPWFQWPHVSEKFWNDHPQWRERTAQSADAHVDWRLVMNFQDPNCLRAVLDDTKRFLLKYDWDGVNIAEFYFESYAGPAAPQIFTPMNHIARAEFASKSGVDPILLFDERSPHFWRRDARLMDAYFRYRTGVTNRLYDLFFSKIASIAAAKKVRWPIVMTTIDVLTHPELADYYGIDMSHMTRLLEKYQATLQLEDEFFDWKLGPDRYTRLGRRYREAYPTTKFMIDVNVVSEGVEPGTRFPTLQPTGAELLEIYHAADRNSDGVAFYSENTVRPWDWPLMPSAMASDVAVEASSASWRVSATRSFALEGAAAQVRVDGEPWACGDGQTILVPAGTHTVSFAPDTGDRVGPVLARISGELTRCAREGRSLRIGYSSASRCLLSLTRAPTKFQVDGKRARLRVIPAGDLFNVFAPAGDHQVEFQ